ncbi:gene transfer agent family protein [Martelella sp. HB161492]|uniref:gene transfer agent family protein n=1 Tax=Martelella sp. HB161492 TaxID=2720726 RepID=UPI001591C4F7|nr:gene transfer agent family protein [Martelella sp. HB161492]
MTAPVTTRRANRHRGEVEAVIDGERRILCLTLGALSELETAFAADNLADLGHRFASGKLKAIDLVRIIGAALRGGGNAFSDEDVAGMSVEGGIAGSARLVSELLSLTFSGSAAAEQPETGADP